MLDLDDSLFNFGETLCYHGFSIVPQPKSLISKGATEFMLCGQLEHFILLLRQSFQTLSLSIFHWIWNFSERLVQNSFGVFLLTQL